MIRGKRDFLADKLLFSSLKDRLGFSKVKSAATGGSAIGPETFKFFLAMGIPLRQLYGQTELMGAYTLQDVPDGTMDCETVGVPFPDCEVKIVDPDPNGLGEIITKHPNMFSGYYNNQKAYKDTIKKGWMYTGDAGFFDEKGPSRPRPVRAKKPQNQLLGVPLGGVWLEELVTIWLRIDHVCKKLTHLN